MIKVINYDKKYREAVLRGITDYFTEEEKAALLNGLDSLDFIGEALVCLDSLGRFVGFSKVTYLPRAAVKLDCIYVTPPLRRDKNGSIIMIAVTTHAVDNLYTKIVCDVESGNAAALAFLKARNFVQTKEENGILHLERNLMPMYKTEAANL